MDISKPKDKNGVSPVIGVILMVAITVIMSAVIYVWVAGFMAVGQKRAPVMSGRMASVAIGDFRYKVTVTSSIPPSSVEGIEYYIMDRNLTAIQSGKVSDVYGGAGNVGVAFVDNDIDGTLSVNDIFLIEAPPARPGYRLMLKSITPDAILLDIALV